MHELKESRPWARWTAVGLAMLALAAQATAQTATQTQTQDAPEDTRKVDVVEYIVRGNTVLGVRDIEKAVTPFLGPERTMKDIEGARDALLAAYQAKGYQSVYVDLPEQQVTEGLVFLQVSETRVGRVRVVGAEYISPLEVRDQVPALKEGQVLDFNQAQVELTALNSTPKRQVMPLVKQGALPGTMDVDLKVQDESPWRGSLGLNNDYSADTRELRATAAIGHDNLWQLGHSASISFYGAPQDLSQTQVITAAYTAPIHGSNWSIDASAYKSDSNVATVGGTNVLGKGHAFGLKATYTVPSAGSWLHTFSAGLELKNVNEALRMADAGDTVPLKYAPITLGYNGFVQGERSQVGLGLSMVLGTSSFFNYGSDWQQFDYKRYKATPSFMVLKGDINGSYTLPGDSQLGFRLAGQITDSPLVSSEQIAAGGMNSVRGYLSAESTGDYGLVGSIEWRTKPLDWFGSWAENWRLYTFADAGRVRLKDPLPEQQDGFTLASVGLGTSLRISSLVNGRIDVGYPLKAGARTERHDTRINFSLTANY
ncbi:ShlB/FhaC/HecB family hemolysin secretion/activation protein [Variovorax sp. HJSM1_2]|uniref:ShlB/FhaC/HecB family hemolysin secretion/activation protein n=1 Tax=Variovorax sp. HJSM1_2 TaxID=3366263 RepID=UPI003BD55B8C